MPLALQPINAIPSQLPLLLRSKESFKNSDLGLGMYLIWKNVYLVLIREALD